MGPRLCAARSETVFSGCIAAFPSAGPESGGCGLPGAECFARRFFLSTDRKLLGPLSADKPEPLEFTGQDRAVERLDDIFMRADADRADDMGRIALVGTKDDFRRSPSAAVGNALQEGEIVPRGQTAVKQHGIGRSLAAFGEGLVPAFGLGNLKAHVPQDRSCCFTDGDAAIGDKTQPPRRKHGRELTQHWKPPPKYAGTETATDRPSAFFSTLAIRRENNIGAVFPHG
jgi:hypothetical protein